MKELVFLLEEPSAKALIEGIISRINESIIPVRYIVFEGKQDMESQIERKLRAYLNPKAVFLVMRDQDMADCVDLKNKLQKKCVNAGKPEAIIRIACRELESWYLADLEAVGQAFNRKELSNRQAESCFRTTDTIVRPSFELSKLVPEYQKIQGSRMIASYIDLNNNRSKSFSHFIKSIRRILE